MLTVEAALARILETVESTAIERVALEESVGRVMAEEVASPIHVPPWDNSAMDGYAVIAADTRVGEVSLVVNETVPAGCTGSKYVTAGTATAVMTGAPIPAGADAVVIVENTNGFREDTVMVRGEAKPGQNIRAKGQDIFQGTSVLARGATCTPANVGLLASLGMTHVKVRRRPTVAILSTGDELVRGGQPLKPGQIYSSNNVALAGMVREAGGIPRDMGIAPDTPSELQAFLEGCLECDIVLTTGGVSAGKYDHVKESWAALGAEMDFWKVRMKPGKPLAFGRVERNGKTVVLFGLPGNPVSCLVNFLQFTRPWIRSALGCEKPFLPVIKVRAGEVFTQRAGREQLMRVTLTRSDGEWVCWSTGSQSSGVLRSMATADALLMIDRDTEAVNVGDLVWVQLIRPAALHEAQPRYRWS